MPRSPFTAAQTAVAEAINGDYLADEAELVEELLPRAAAAPALGGAIADTARGLITRVRERRRESASGMDALLAYYDLSSQEGIVLMCLAEALLRIPDADTADRLIADKLSPADWQRHLGDSESWFVNASTWALMISGRLLRSDEAARRAPLATLNDLLVRLEEPLVRAALKTAMRLMAHEYVMGASIEEALQRAGREENRRYRYSFDMLGEAALTAAEAERYQDAYRHAITALAGAGADAQRLGISVKLSALSPRYEPLQGKRALAELSARLRELAAVAAEADLPLTVDAEESDRLTLSLAVFRDVFEHFAARPWQGLGLAVQAYQKRAPAVLAWLNALAEQAGKTIPVRLVKGAYWDTEIKRSQERGLAGFPVYTRKRNTDVAYLACVRLLLERCPRLRPQFATHNAHTLSYVYHHADHAGERAYEFQRLHGMGEELYAEVVDPAGLDRPCRVYAPVGAHAQLLPYLVRRLLENGANTSFVNQIADPDIAVGELLVDPVAVVERRGRAVVHPRIRLPRALFGDRRNSSGTNFADEREVARLLDAVERAPRQRTARPRIAGEALPGEGVEIANPADPRAIVGRVEFADAALIARAISAAHGALPAWRDTAAEQRATLLEAIADRLESDPATVIALCVREAGKTLLDAHDDVREAIDFLRYYAAECRRLFAAPRELPGPSGEQNQLFLEGRGVFLCISPWNFPAAIFTGQIAAALAAGNTVIAKPAEQSSLTAAALSELFYDAGIPADVLGFLPARGATVGDAALGDERLAGIAFTGSVATARRINRALAARDGPLPTLIAETGGVNAMLVDSSALPEQVVIDITRSAFNSTGQRCSALRVLYLQDDVAGHMLELLFGHLDELVIGDPADPATDIGPVIDADARDALNAHIDRFRARGRVLYQAPRPAAEGLFVPPTVIELQALAELPGEVFGPVLHVIRYTAGALDAVVDEINAGGYGLTFGIHSRIERRADDLGRRIQAGNVYVNRNMIGAVVGVQPFGGRGLSGTGPKAGGPHYLERFAAEKSVSVNTAAIGGNASLLAGD